MIKNISGMNNVVVNYGNSFMPYVNMSNPSAGMVRYNGNNQSMEVYDGTTWFQFNQSYATIDLNSSANAAIAWALDKIAEESKIQKMAQEHPAVRAAYETFKRAGEQLQTTIILSQDEETTS